MSMHARTTPEARAALAAQKRNSTIASLFIALLSCLFIGLLFWVVKILAPVEGPDKKLTGYIMGDDIDNPMPRQVVSNSVKRKPSPPSNSSTPMIRALSKSPFSVLSPPDATGDPSPDFGGDVDFGSGGGGTGIGKFGDGSKGFLSIPKDVRKRCDVEERLARVKEMGGNLQCEMAVVKSLDWIMRTQNADGSSHGEHKVAMTGLSLLCFLGHCETPESPRYGEAVEKAIIYLVNVAKKNDGKLADDLTDKHWVYQHAIATYALAEAYTFSKINKYQIPGLKEAVLMSGNVLIQGQASNGGWRYAFSYDGHHDDTSVTGFCMQALKACKHTGLPFKYKRASAKGLDYIENCQLSSGQIGYMGKKHPKDTITGAGLLCFQQWGKGKSRSARRALKHLKENVSFKYGAANLYGHYYYGQAFMEAGGETWKAYNKMFRDEMLSGQNQDGSYRPSELFGDNLHYRTCMATLSLEVYYRFLPGTSAN